MNDIYLLLPKHFMQEASPTEEAFVAEYVKINGQEYKALRKIWLKEGVVSVADFDAKKAWEVIKEKIVARKKHNVIIVPFYKKLKYIAAAAVILLISFATVFYNGTTEIKQTFVEVESIHRGQEILLADGTQVWLNESSKISYPEVFDKNTRVVKLRGEAFFEVAKNVHKPFIITTGHTSITVLGTSFNVQDEGENTRVSVKTGKVQIQSSFTTDKVILTPRQSVIVGVDKMLTSQLENENYLAWKTGVFEFSNTELMTVIEDLNSYYSNQIILEKENSDCHFTGKFNKASIEDILKVLKRSCRLNIIEQDGKHVIK